MNQVKLGNCQLGRPKIWCLSLPKRPLGCGNDFPYSEMTIIAEALGVSISDIVDIKKG